MRDHIADCCGDEKGDTRSLDYGSFEAPIIWIIGFWSR